MQLNCSPKIRKRTSKIYVINSVKNISFAKRQKLNMLGTSAICFLYWGQRSEVVASFRTEDFLINNANRGQEWLCGLGCQTVSRVDMWVVELLHWLCQKQTEGPPQLGNCLLTSGKSAQMAETPRQGLSPAYVYVGVDHRDNSCFSSGCGN